MSLGRRSFMVSALAMACLPRRPVAVSPPQRLRLGWRLVPGQQLDYTCRVEHRVPGRSMTRIERWSYLVTSRERTVCALDGVLLGLDASVRSPGHPDDPLAARRRRGARIHLRLGADGRIRPTAGLGCAFVSTASTTCFGAHLPHRMLDLALPDTPVAPGTTWRDPALAAPFRALVPGESQLTVQATCAVAEIYVNPLGEVRVDLLSTLLIRAGIPALRADGRTTWDPLRGVMTSRTLRLRATGLGPSVGQLDIDLRASTD